MKDTRHILINVLQWILQWISVAIQIDTFFKMQIHEKINDV